MANRDQRAKPGDKRSIEFRAFEGRVDAASGGFSGYASTFWRIDSYGTAIAPGSFTKTLSERRDKLHVLYQHNPDWAIGKIDQIEQDEVGLRHDSSVVDDGAEGTVALKRLRFGVPFGQSFGFRTVRERPATEDDPVESGDTTPEYYKRNPLDVYVIEEVKLYEISLVTFPANDAAVIESVRAETGAQALAQTLEDLRTGRLDAAGRALVSHLVTAWQDAAPDAVTSAPRTSDEQARRDRESVLAAMAASCGLTVQEMLCAA